MLQNNGLLAVIGLFILVVDGAATSPAGVFKAFIRNAFTTKKGRSNQQLEDVICPDGVSYCPTNTTCCKLSTGQYGCCPFPQAVCCGDGVHCCPKGYKCNTQDKTCMRGNEIKTMHKMASKIATDDVNVICKDGSDCFDHSTCCKLPSGDWGCCPYPNATCCSDKIHCCPEGYSCNVTNSVCSKSGEMTLKALTKVATKDLGSVICPGGASQCPDGTTCCQLSTGGWACCPLPKAVCCKDHLHCCPNGYSCDTGAGTCTKQGKPTIKAVTKFSAKDLGSVICPGGKTECPDRTTCCQLPSGTWACCPFPKAVCCKDHINCCPNGYKCDPSTGTCDKSGEPTIKALTKFNAKDLGSVTCPGGMSACPDGTTCCQLPGGQYGCCPFPKAVCCKDHIHCCPNGYTCDTGTGTCNKKGETTIKALTKFNAKDLGSVTCPGGASECPDGSTCCQLSSGDWACCPFQKAVCCKDHIHCCPNGYTCDTGAGTCNKNGETTVKALTKINATDLGSVVCPGGRSECPDGTTCCQLPGGQYGCCPFPRAVCCKDGTHCCPNGYKCDTSAGTCNKQGEPTIKALAKFNAKDLGSVTCPGGASQCPDGSTCCQLSSGDWACCPSPKAVCCKDHIHCCPNGYTCDTGAGTCNKKGETTIKALTKIIARDLGSVKCPGGGSECPDGSTCCQLASGDWACCPFPKAVCCKDHIHCCPNGYTCDSGAGTCNKKGETTIKALIKINARDLGSVVCPGGRSECPDGTTCCQLPGGQYGCCPFTGAVCCKDGTHCCPNGYKCDTSAGTCNKQGEPTIKALAKFNAKDLGYVTCPGGKSECPDGSTCCQLATGDWACCPFQKAVCCKDHIHCCPNGYTCDTGAGTCNKKGETTIKALTKINARAQESGFLALKPSKTGVERLIEDIFWKKERGNCVMCPDDSECPNFNTCCQLADGRYGCCGYSSAVCCADHTHCCRHGYTCDVQHGLCIQGGGKREPMSKMRLTDRMFASKSSKKFTEM